MTIQNKDNEFFLGNLNLGENPVTLLLGEIFL